MTSERIEYGRRERMLELAEEAKSILYSETEELDHPIWSSKTTFLENNVRFASQDQLWSYDGSMDLMALVVLDDFPAETLNEILGINLEVTDEPYLWLADTYDTIPDYDPSSPPEGDFQHREQRSALALHRRIFARHRRFHCGGSQATEAVVQGELRCNIELSTESQSEIKLQWVPCPIDMAGHFFISFHHDHWNLCDHVMALFVLDEMPKATLNKILDDNLELSGEAHLWLADSYNNLPNYRPNYKVHGNKSPVDSDWQSPFVGKSIAEAANFVRNIPNPPKPLCKEMFAVLQRDRFEQIGKLTLCRIFPVGGQVNMSENDVYGAEVYRKSGRSIMCRINPGAGQHTNGDQGEFEMQMVEIKANDVADFFSLFERDETHFKIL
ncbi:hypothetical protein MBLNU13_g03068t1 [Cladosporium sp. NU13]